MRGESPNTALELLRVWYDRERDAVRDSYVSPRDRDNDKRVDEVWEQYDPESFELARRTLAILTPHPTSELSCYCDSLVRWQCRGTTRGVIGTTLCGCRCHAAPVQPGEELIAEAEHQAELARDRGMTRAADAFDNLVFALREVEQDRERRPVLMLASYCGDDNSDCADDLPCIDCLRMCNVARANVSGVKVKAGWDYLDAARRGAVEHDELAAEGWGGMTIRVTRCARCGTEHDLNAAPLSNSADEWTHWAMCPVTSQPVLVRTSRMVDPNHLPPEAQDEIRAFEERLLRRNRATNAALSSLLERVREFVAAHGRSGGKTGRADYAMILPLSEVEPLRIALDEYDRVRRDR